MKKLIKSVLAIGLFVHMFIATGASASTPIQLSMIGGVNLPEDSTVVGVRFPLLYGKTANVTGLDLHLIAISEVDNFKGVQFPLLVVGANHINSSMTGVSMGLWNINRGQATGLNMALLNMTNNVKGANLGLINMADGHTSFDWSVANFSGSSTVQLGLVNFTDRIDGLQIGLLNCADNGFLPCFPFILF